MRVLPTKMSKPTMWVTLPSLEFACFFPLYFASFLLRPSISRMPCSRMIQILRSEFCDILLLQPAESVLSTEGGDRRLQDLVRHRLYLLCQWELAQTRHRIMNPQYSFQALGFLGIVLLLLQFHLLLDLHHHQFLPMEVILLSLGMTENYQA